MAVSETNVDVKVLFSLHDIAQRNNCIDHEIKFDKQIGVSGYSSNITQAQITSKQKEINLLIKSCGITDKIRSALPVELIFKREIYIYETILPKFQEFEIQHDKEPLSFTPEYYDGYSNKSDGDAIFLENLKELRYTLYHPKELLDDDHVKLVLTKYSHFHAISLAYKDQNPTKFTELVEPLDDILVQLFKSTGYLDVLIKQMKKSTASLDSGIHRNVKNVYENFIKETENFLLNMPLMVDEFSVVVHGDCWKNNLLFQYAGNSISTPTDVRLVDFQLARISSPMVDVANFLYACSSKNILDRINEYLQFYYNNLSSRLEELGSDPNKVYPFSVMHEHWKKFARYGLIVRITSLIVMLSEEKERKSLNDVVETDGGMSNMFDYEISNIDKYHDLNRHSIIHFVNNNLI